MDGAWETEEEKESDDNWPGVQEMLGKLDIACEEVVLGSTSTEDEEVMAKEGDTES